MTVETFVPKSYQNKPVEGSYTWKSPSNIALVKYWGKTEPQIPANPSISFTLNNCHTVTTLSYHKRSDASSDVNFSFDVYLDGEFKPDFAPKIATFLKRIEKYLPFLKTYHFKIETSNSFPHSSGIASSASGMSALALCLMSIEKELIPEMSDEFFKQKASFLARLGSGSACRSIEGPVVVWGTHEQILNSSNLFGVLFEDGVHQIFSNYQDTILLVDVGEKAVSSTVGHNLMHNHPFAKERFEQANINLSKLKAVLKEGNLDLFIEIVESEALTLHAMMMTSMPYYLLMKANTLKIIEKIWSYRKETGMHVCFTLDAGANVHLLYPENEKDAILQFIKNELVVYCKNEQYICDQIGFGAKKL